MNFDKIINSQIDVFNHVKRSITANSSTLLTYFNQHCFNIYYKNEEYKKLIDNNFAIYLDGFGMYLSLKMFTQKTITKFNASDLNEKILNYLSKEKIGTYFLGGDFDKSMWNNTLLTKGIVSLGYKNGYQDIIDEQLLFSELKAVNPKVVVIGLGVPKQELLGYKISEILNSSVIICVGNFLEFYFGTKKRAPLFLRDSGFEWLFRLFTEPKRLWKRYIFGIPLFFYRILRIYFHKNQSYEDVS